MHEQNSQPHQNLGDLGSLLRMLGIVTLRGGSPNMMRLWGLSGPLVSERQALQKHLETSGTVNQQQAAI